MTTDDQTDAPEGGVRPVHDVNSATDLPATVAVSATDLPATALPAPIARAAVHHPVAIGRVPIAREAVHHPAATRQTREPWRSVSTRVAPRH